MSNGIFGGYTTAGTIREDMAKVATDQDAAIKRDDAQKQKQSQMAQASASGANTQPPKPIAFNIPAAKQYSDPPKPNQARSVPHLAEHSAYMQHDVDWIGDTFMLSHLHDRTDVKNITEDDLIWMYFSTAMDKFTNTSIGGNIVINPLPKFCRFADPPVGKLVAKVDVSNNDQTFAGGMGIGYSEAFDDHNQRVYMRFGFPQYKGMITFFTGFYDSESSVLGREGRLLEKSGYIVGKVFGTILTTVVALTAWPLTLAVGTAAVFNFLMNRPSTRYYDIKPSMDVFWQRAAYISSELAANKRLVARNAPETWSNGYELNKMGYDKYNDDYTHNSYHEVEKMMGEGVFSKSGGFDIRYVATKAQRMEKQAHEELERISRTASSPNDLRNRLMAYSANFKISDKGGEKMSSVLDRYYNSPYGIAIPEDQNSDPYKERLAGASAKYSMGSQPVAQNGESTDQAAAAAPTSNDAPANAEEQKEKNIADAAAMAEAYASHDNFNQSILEADENGNKKLKPASYWQQMGQYLQERIKGGGEWVCLRVDKMDSFNESFSNNTGPSEIQSKINQTASSMQAARFSMSDFNTGFGAVDTVVDTIRSTIAGVASGLYLDGLVQLSGAGFVDIPDRYTDSSSSAGNHQFSLELRAPYGNRLSQFFNIDVPLSMLLAAALPISHGNQSYGPPMLVEMYMPGKAVVKLGMITNLSITRGGDNNAWNNLGDCTCISVQFEIKNLSTIVHAPITTGLEKVMPPWAGIFGQDNAFNDYLNILSNMSVRQMSDPRSDMWQNLSKKNIAVKQRFGPASVAGWMADSTPARIAATISQYTSQTGRAVQLRY